MCPERLPPAPRGRWYPPRALRPLLLGLAWCGLWAGSAACWRIAGPRLLLNLTPSVPRGLYRVTPWTTVTRGMLVVVPPPTSVAALFVARGYLAPQTPLLKPVAALAGDQVCVDATGVHINRVWMASVATVDTSGRPLPSWQGCVTLHDDEVFLLSPWHAHSLDSRYFGPVPVATLLGRATPMLTLAAPLWTGDWGRKRAKGQDTARPSGGPQRALRVGITGASHVPDPVPRVPTLVPTAGATHASRRKDGTISLSPTGQWEGH